MSTVQVHRNERISLTAPMVAEAKKNFVGAAKAFELNPGADKWVNLRIAMLAYQQAMQIRNSYMHQDLPEFMQRWQATSPELRSELIVRYSTGKSINQIDINK